MSHLMRLRSVLDKTGLSRSLIYKQMKDGIFPRSVKIDSRACAWVSSEVDAYIGARIAGKSDAELKRLCDHLLSQRQRAW